MFPNNYVSANAPNRVQKSSRGFRKRSGSLLATALVIAVFGVTAQAATYTWQGGAGASWAVAANWTPARTTPAVTDVLQFNAGGAATPTAVPTQTIGQLLISNNTAVTLTSAAGTLTLSIGQGIAGTDLDVASGSSLTLANGGTAFTVNPTAGQTGTASSIAGTLTVNTGVTWNVTTGTTSTTSVAGTVVNAGTGTITASGATLTFASGGKYTHNQNGRTIPTATWSSGSTCSVTGITGTVPAGLGQSFANFTWASAGQTGTITLAGALTTVNGDFSVTATNGRQLRLFSATAPATFTMNIGGNLVYSDATAGGFLRLNQSSGTATINVAGNLTMSSAGTLELKRTAAGVTTLNVSGSFSQTAGIFQSNTATSALVFKGATKTFTQSAGTFSTTNLNITVDTGASLTLNNNLSISTGRSLTVNSTAVLSPAAAVLVSGAGTLTGAGTVQVTRTAATADFLNQYTITTTTLTNLTVDYAGAGAQTINTTPIDATNYGGLKTSGSGTKTLGGVVTVNSSGGVTIGSGTTLDVGASNFAMTVAGNWTNNGGTFTPRSGTVTFNGTAGQAINGTAASQTFNNVTLTKTAGTTLSVGGSTTSLTVNNLTETTGNFTGPATLDINGTLILTAGTFTAGTSINVAGDWTKAAGATFTFGTSSVTFDGSAAQAINGTSTSQTFYNLIINKSAQTLTVSGSTTTLTVNDLNETAGNFTPPATTNVNGNFVHNAGAFMAGSNLNIVGTWTNNAVGFNANSGTVVSSAPVIGGATSTTFNNLLINNGAGVLLGTDEIINGILNLTNGNIVTGSNTLIIGSTGSISGGSSSSYLIGNMKKTAVPNGSFTFPVGTSTGFTPLNLTNATGGGDLTVTTKTPQQPVLSAGTSLQEYWMLTKAGTLTTDLTFNYLQGDVNGTEANYRIVVVESGNATSFPNACPSGNFCVDTSANTATAKNVSSFSDWTVAEPNAPTAVKLMKFAATNNNGEVEIQWQSGYEAHNLGYYVYREQNGKRVQITPSLVAGSALLVGQQTVMSAGRSYTWYDSSQKAEVKGEPMTADALQGATYWLEDVDVNGTRTLHGPIAAEPVYGEKSRAAQSELLSEVARRQPVTGTMYSSWPADYGPQQTQLLTPPRPTGKGALTQREIAGMAGLKLAVSKTGWYRVTVAEMLAAGFNPKEGAAQLQLYANGVEVPVKLSGNGTLTSETDYLEFSGHGLDTPTDAAQTYYLVVGRSSGKRIGTSNDGRPGEPSGPQSFEYTIERKDRFIYYAALLNGDGENTFGHIVRPTAVSETIPVSHPDGAGGAARLEVSLVGVTKQGHSVTVSLNGQNLGTVEFSNNEHPSKSFSVPQSLVREGDNTVQFASLGGDTDISLVDTMRLTYAHQYAADNDALTVSINNAKTKRVSGFSGGGIRAVDITNPSNLVEVPALVSKDEEQGSYRADVQLPGANPRSPHTVLVFADNTAAHPDSVRSNEPSTWGTHTAGSDYLIITRSELQASVEPLAAMRRGQGLVVEVVDVEDLYDEFSYGQHTPQAIKDFLRTATTNWQRQPHYVLLAGDASYDPKNYTGQGYNDQVPTKLVDTGLLETASDDWLADFDGDGVADLAIGRLPVRTAAALEVVVNKIINYEQMTPDPQRGALLVADSGFEAASSGVQALLPAGVPVQTINRSSADDATIHNQILSSLNQGPQLANYFGHGSNGVWTGASLLSLFDAPGLTNQNRLSVYVTMTCFNGYFQDATYDSMAEALLKAPGGAVAVWASSGMTEPGQQSVVDQELFRQLFGGGTPTLGDAVRAAKRTTNDADLRRTWILFGDPATRLR